MRREAQRRRAVITVLAMSMLAIVSTGATAAEPTRTSGALPAGASDITNTSRGRQLAAEAAERFAKAGVAPGALRVVKDAAGITVARAGTQFGPYSERLANGTVVTALAPITAARPSTNVSATQAGVTIVGPWQFQGNDCFSRISDGWAWMDHCYTMYRLSNDGNGTYDWFALAHYASMDANSTYWLLRAKIGESPHSGSSAQTWADWTPKSDWTGSSCSTITIGIATPAAGIGFSTDRCPDKWNMTKSSPAVVYSLEWTGATKSTRELGFEISVRVAQGGWPQWLLPAEVHGYPFIL